MRSIEEFEEDLKNLHNLIMDQYKELDNLNLLYNSLRIELNSHR